MTRYLVRGTVEIVRGALLSRRYDLVTDHSCKKMHSQQIRKVELAKVGFQSAEGALAEAAS